MATTEYVGVPIHKDVTEYEGRIFGGLTGRQITCIAAALVLTVGVAVLGLKVLELPNDLVMTIATPCVAIPALLAMGTPEGLKPEVYAQLMLLQYTTPQRLVYRKAAEPVVTSFHGCRHQGPDVTQE